MTLLPLSVVGASHERAALALPATTTRSRGVLGAIGVGASHADFVYRNRFTEPAPCELTTSGVAYVINFAPTAAGVIVGSASSNKAAAPATCGAAIEVPDRLRNAVDEV